MMFGNSKISAKNTIFINEKVCLSPKLEGMARDWGNPIVLIYIISVIYLLILIEMFQ